MIPPHARPLYQYAKLVGEKGTPQEKFDLANDIRAMRELRKEFPDGSQWEPMEHVVLIGWLFNDFSLQVAARRQQLARMQRYRDHQGKVGRSLEEEQKFVRGELALQVCLGIPLGKPDSKEEARVVGNAGRRHDAFVPVWNPLFHRLIVNPTTADDLFCWLVVPEGGSSYRLKGWIMAKDAKQPQHYRVRQREGGESKAYWVDPAYLQSVKGWWDQWSG